MADSTLAEDSFESIRARLHNAIPGGAHTYSRGDDQFPSIAPPILERGKGSYVWDSAGKKYLDYGMALRAVTLGYANERVNKRAIDEMNKGVNLTRPSFVELEAAEKLIDLVPSVEMVKFAKNGSNVTTAAVKVARAYTGRKYVCVPRQQPFFSYDDWFIGTTPIERGIPDEAKTSTLMFDYGDIDSLKQLFEKFAGKIAAVIMEPATNVSPCSSCNGVNVKDWWITGCKGCNSSSPNFLQDVQHLCNKSDTVFIIDEMITGFRWSQSGAQKLFGMTPDLSTFGKGMSNGHSLAALGGRKEIMSVGSTVDKGMERTFLLSSTHGAEMPALGAFLETMKVYEEESVINHLWNYGSLLKEKFNYLAAHNGLEQYLSMEGPAISLNYSTKSIDGQVSLEFRTLLAQELLKNGVMMPWVAISHSHGERELDITVKALSSAFEVYKKALYEGVEKYLTGPAIKPVFRKYN